jgi:hypothetical protein
MVLKTTFTVGTTEVTLEAAANYASPACFNFTKTEEGFCFLTLKGFTGTFKLRTLDAAADHPSTAADRATNKNVPNTPTQDPRTVTRRDVEELLESPGVSSPFQGRRGAGEHGCHSEEQEEQEQLQGNSGAAYESETDDELDDDFQATQLEEEGSY